MRYKRIELEVRAYFSADGMITPEKIYFVDKCYNVDGIICIRRHCPTTVGCIAPTEYTVIIEGREKNIYFEADTSKWFSIKEL